MHEVGQANDPAAGFEQGFQYAPWYPVIARTDRTTRRPDLKVATTVCIEQPAKYGTVVKVLHTALVDGSRRAHQRHAMRVADDGIVGNGRIPGVAEHSLLLDSRHAGNTRS